MVHGWSMHMSWFMAGLEQERQGSHALNQPYLNLVYLQRHAGTALGTDLSKPSPLPAIVSSSFLSTSSRPTQDHGKAIRDAPRLVALGQVLVDELIRCQGSQASKIMSMKRQHL